MALPSRLKGGRGVRLQGTVFSVGPEVLISYMWHAARWQLARCGLWRARSKEGKMSLFDDRWHGVEDGCLRCVRRDWPRRGGASGRHGGCVIRQFASVVGLVRDRQLAWQSQCGVVPGRWSAERFFFWCSGSVRWRREMDRSREAWGMLVGRGLILHAHGAFQLVSHGTRASGRRQSRARVRGRVVEWRCACNVWIAAPLRAACASTW